MKEASPLGAVLGFFVAAGTFAATARLLTLMLLSAASDGAAEPSGCRAFLGARTAAEGLLDSSTEAAVPVSTGAAALVARKNCPVT